MSPGAAQDIVDLQVLRPGVALPAALGGALEPLVEALSTPASLSSWAIRIRRGPILTIGGVVLSIMVSTISLRGLAGGTLTSSGIRHDASWSSLEMLIRADKGDTRRRRRQGWL